jgi:transcriptional regulator with XRE-family HTH domain
MCVKYHVRKITHVYTWRDTVAAVQKPRHQKTATQLWVADNRKRLGETPADLARLTGVTTDTARGWESRGSPGPDAIRVLEVHFGVSAPVGSGGAFDTASPDLATAIRELVEELRSARQERAEQEQRLRALEAAVALLAQRDDGPDPAPVAPGSTTG